ncbi:DUF3519 domain-containing protein [Helicobacter pylori]|uniref:DUF3519 domain-containing protein n=1 Tax=Helicobacter pylori TaxID=210 RepID=UPI0009B3D3BC|nr:DUF3519 domain-containing protein [Helicobacter pylori]
MIERVNNGVKLRLVADDLNNGNKVFDFYSDRNLTDFKDSRPLPSTLNKGILSQKDLTSQEDLLKRTENLNELTKEPTHLSPLEQANAKKLAKLQSEQDF